MGKYLIVAGIIALLLGAGVAIATHNGYLSINTKPVDNAVQQAGTTLAEIQANLEVRDNNVKTEVRTIYQTVQNRVAALNNDSVADGLNDELRLWRLAARSGRLDSTK